MTQDNTDKNREQAQQIKETSYVEQIKAGLNDFITAWMMHEHQKGLNPIDAAAIPISWVRSFCDDLEQILIEEQQKQGEYR